MSRLFPNLLGRLRKIIAACRDQPVHKGGLVHIEVSFLAEFLEILYAYRIKLFHNTKITIYKINDLSGKSISVICIVSAVNCIHLIDRPFRNFALVKTVWNFKIYRYETVWHFDNMCGFRYFDGRL